MEGVSDFEEDEGCIVEGSVAPGGQIGADFIYIYVVLNFWRIDCNCPKSTL